MRKLFRTLWRCAYPLLIYLGVTFLVEVIFGTTKMIATVRDRGMVTFDTVVGELLSQALLITGIVSVICVVIFFFLMKKDNKIMPPLGFEKAGLFEIMLWMFIGLTAAIAGNIIMNMLGLSRGDDAFQRVSEILGSAPMWMQIAVAVVLGPLCEEMLFRGIIFRRIKLEYSFAAACIISSVLFGVFHGNLTQGVYGAVMGFIFALGYHKTGRFLVPFMMHLTANYGIIIMEAVM